MRISQIENIDEDRGRQKKISRNISLKLNN